MIGLLDVVARCGRGRRSLLVALLVVAASAAAAQAPRGAGLVEEQRIALVIGNAAYRDEALDNPVHDARLIGATLRQAGFQVSVHENLTRRAMLAALQQFGDQLNDRTVAVLFYAGHGIQLREHNYMVPVDAEFRREDDVVLNSVDIAYILDRMAQARSRVNIVILDACRDNPFAKRGSGSATAQGLALMDAPVDTVLAFATAPGKKAPDNAGGGANSVYSAHLARHLLTRGLPVELMFKRVREGVVRETRALQVPWEHSSLRGEFAFVPGVAESTPAAAPAEPAADAEAALWAGIETSRRADDFRSFLRQYPNGRFAAAARSALESLTAATAPAAAAAPAGSGARAELMPRAGDTWRYRIVDQFRFGDVFVTARVDAVSADGVAETWTTTSDAKVRTTLVPFKPGFSSLPGWTTAPPEFAPYLQAAAAPGDALAAIGSVSRRVDAVSVPLKAQWLADEDVVVAAGRFRAQKLQLRGESPASRSGGAQPRVSAEVLVWYAPAVRRIVKYQVLAHAGRTLRESTTFELTEYKLN